MYNIVVGHCCEAQSEQSRNTDAGLSRFIVPRPHLRGPRITFLMPREVHHFTPRVPNKEAQVLVDTTGVCGRIHIWTWSFGHPETRRRIWIQEFYPDYSDRFRMFFSNDWWRNFKRARHSDNQSDWLPLYAFLPAEIFLLVWRTRSRISKQ